MPQIDLDDERRASAAKSTYQATQVALKSITMADVTALKNYETPPHLVQRVLEAVCILRGLKPQRVRVGGRMIDDYWPVIRPFVGNTKDFMLWLNTLDPRTVPVSAMKKICSEYTSDPGFNPSTIHCLSPACGRLCTWILAMADYFKAVQAIEAKACASSPVKGNTPAVGSPAGSPPRQSPVKQTPPCNGNARSTPRSGSTPIPRPKLDSAPVTPHADMELDQNQHQQPEYELPPRVTDQTLVFIRFRRDLYDAFRNSVVKSKSIIKNYTGSFIGVAKEMTMISNGDGPSADNNITVGVLCFQRLDKCKLWAVSDTNMRQQDWLDGVDEIAVPLYEPLEIGYVFQVCNLVVNDAADLYHRYLPALDSAVAKYAGRVIAKSPQNIKFKGLWEPHFVVVIQWRSQLDIDRFHVSEDNPPTNCNHGQVAQFEVAYDL